MGRTLQTTSLQNIWIRELTKKRLIQARKLKDGCAGMDLKAQMNGVWLGSVPPEASWAHRQVQRSLSLSLVLNWVPEWARLLIRPAVPLKFSAWRLYFQKKKKERKKRILTYSKGLNRIEGNKTHSLKTFTLSDAWFHSEVENFPNDSWSTYCSMRSILP